MSDSARPKLDESELPAAVTARMYVNEMRKSASVDTAVLAVAYGNGHNKEWAAATPSGTAQLTLAKANAASQFFEAAMEAGDDIEITFRRVPRDK